MGYVRTSSFTFDSLARFNAVFFLSSRPASLVVQRNGSGEVSYQAQVRSESLETLLWIAQNELADIFLSADNSGCTGIEILPNPWVFLVDGPQVFQEFVQESPDTFFDNSYVILRVQI